VHEGWIEVQVPNAGEQLLVQGMLRLVNGSSQVFVALVGPPVVQNGEAHLVHPEAPTEADEGGHFAEVVGLYHEEQA
jgi:hypothetical protein